jgi:hypothetical protein
VVRIHSGVPHSSRPAAGSHLQLKRLERVVRGRILPTPFLQTVFSVVEQDPPVSRTNPADQRLAAGRHVSHRMLNLDLTPVGIDQRSGLQLLAKFEFHTTLNCHQVRVGGVQPVARKVEWVPNPRPCLSQRKGDIGMGRANTPAASSGLMIVLESWDSRRRQRPPSDFSHLPTQNPDPRRQGGPMDVAAMPARLEMPRCL